MTAVSESFAVQEWASSCGPAPVSGTLLPGGPVTIQSQGDELVISGGRRTLRTDQCLDPMPTLARDVHSHAGRSWRTRCSTPPSDPRHAVVNTAYFLAAGDDSISVAETGRYEFVISGSRCVADVTRSASLARVVQPASPPVAASAVPAPADTASAPLPADTTPPPPSRVDCSAPGEPARLEVRPSRKLLKLGDSFTFRATVVDANGCPTGTPIQWTTGAVAFKDGQVHSGDPSIDATGKLTVPSLEFADASFDVIATAAGHSAKASVEVSSPANYEALLAQSGLGPSGERDEPSVAILATGSIGAANARAEDGARRRRILFIAVVGGLALVLGVVAIIGGARARKAKAAERAASDRHAEKMREYERHKQEREQRHAQQMRVHLESVARAQQIAAANAARGIDSGPMFCPSCRRDFPPGSVFCPQDSNRLVPQRGHEALMTGPAGGICPTCKRGFNPGVKVCPHDGDELVPLGMAKASAPPPASAGRGKICPTCGARFEGNAAFCGKDGTQLVLVN
jgi:hypothetical protein